MSKCDRIGHSWQPTNFSGWFQCMRVLRYSQKGVPTYCNTPALCPGCLGYRLAGVLSILCFIHEQTCILEAFPVLDRSPRSTSEVSSYTQSSLW